MKKQGNKNFLKPVITNSNVAKETNPVKATTFVEVRSKSSRSTETEIVHEKPNQPDTTFVFPKTAFAKQHRSCQAQWFVDGLDPELILGSCKISPKKIYYKKMRQIKGILLSIILTESASKQGYHGTGMDSQTK